MKLVINTVSCTKDLLNYTIPVLMMRSSLIKAALLLPLFAAPLVYASQYVSEMPVKLSGAVNNMSEQCLPIKSGSSFSYQFESARPLDFNIHYHTEKTTDFEVKESGISRYTGQFSTAVDREYCFMWTNKTAAKTGVNFSLYYTVAQQ